MSDIRDKFISYFARKNHTVVPSSSLVPQGDDTILFTNSGMVQFKDIFLGLVPSKYQQAVSAQKCIRAGGKHNDLDNVGYTTRHHTFFEMLGNFSFGSYFKETAISYAWELVTKEFCLDIDRIYITVYHEDEESYNLWKKIANISDDRILKVATNDNFWSMGNTGPCGPCTEIYYDCRNGHNVSFSQDIVGLGSRFVEIYNLVFMEYNRQENGDMIPLATKCVDTGMGLERVYSIVEGVYDNYKTELFSKIITNINKIYGTDLPNSDTSLRVIADHIRSISFLIADGVLPSNEGRGYVLRRIMRRAMRYANYLDSKKQCLSKVVDVLVENMSLFYPELSQKYQIITKTIDKEESLFGETLARGIDLIDDEIKKIGNNSQKINGDLAFKLYDTYGFPLDLTVDIARQNQLTVDIDKFDILMEQQKSNSKNNQNVSKYLIDSNLDGILQKKYEPTKILYKNEGLLKSGCSFLVENCKVKVVDLIEISGQSCLIFDQTCCYAESGGQAGDSASLLDDNGLIITEILNARSSKSGVVIHYLSNIFKSIEIGKSYQMIINKQVRNMSRKNHTATHLLHSALRLTLGADVSQKGSLVDCNKLRFDFSYGNQISHNQIIEIENIVNSEISKSIPVVASVMNREKAKQAGAIGLFEDKYADEVRVLQISDFSTELCGGMHVDNTGNIGYFKIISECSVASGVRRIEAITGEVALNYNYFVHNQYEQIVKLLPQKTALDCGKFENLQYHQPTINLVDFVKDLIEQKNKLQKDNLDLIVLNEIESIIIEIEKGNRAIHLDISVEILNAIIVKLPKMIKSKTLICLYVVSDNKIMAKLWSNDSEFDCNIVFDKIKEKLDNPKGGGSKNFTSFSTEDVEKFCNNIDKIINI